MLNRCYGMNLGSRGAKRLLAAMIMNVRLRSEASQPKNRIWTCLKAVYDSIYCAESRHTDLSGGRPGLAALCEGVRAVREGFRWGGAENSHAWKRDGPGRHLPSAIAVIGQQQRRRNLQDSASVPTRFEISGSSSAK